MTTKPEQPGANHLSIEERLEQAVLELEPSLMCENSYAKDILRRYFGDLGGDYSCAVCGFGMKEPCEHWKKMLAASAESQSPAVNSIHEIRPFELPSCHICGAQMTPKTYKCGSCKATTGVEALSNEHPQSYLDGTTAAAENISPTINAGGGIDRGPQSEPLCRVKGCGKPLQYHTRLGEYNSHPFDSTTERRIGAKERRVWDTGSWASREKRSALFQRTGPSDRRRKPLQDSAIGDETSAQPGKKEGPCQNQPDTTSIATVTAASVGGNSQSESASAGTSDTPVACNNPTPGLVIPSHCAHCRQPIGEHVINQAAGPAPQVTAPEHGFKYCDGSGDVECLCGMWFNSSSYPKFNAHVASFLLAEREARDPVLSEREPKSPWYKLREVRQHTLQWKQRAQTAEATVAERDRTIAELKRRKGDHCCDAQFDLEAMRQHFTALGLTETNTKKDGLIEQIWRNTRAEQAEGVFCEAHSASECESCPCCVAVADRILNEATAERLRGLLREADVILLKLVKDLKTGAHYHAILALRQRIQKELGDRP